MNALLTPAGEPEPRFAAVGTFALLVSSAACVFLAPLAMPASYSWVANVISESAAQNVANAWVARLGFLLFGSAVLWLAMASRSRWVRGAYWFHMAFAVFMIATAAFSHRPWLPGVPFDPLEDHLHSFTATAMGFAFSFGVVARLLQRDAGEKGRRLFDIVAVAAAIALPSLSGVWPSAAGLLQRSMFLIAYLWYGVEAVALHGTRGR